MMSSLMLQQQGKQSNHYNCSRPLNFVEKLQQWVKKATNHNTTDTNHGQNSYTSNYLEAESSSDTCLLLSVLGAALAPVATDNNAVDSIVLDSIRSIPQEASSAQYIIQQYVCACGLTKSCKNGISSYIAMGRLAMLASRLNGTTLGGKNNWTKHGHSNNTSAGYFILWQLNPNIWNLELTVNGSKLNVGSNGKLMWRQTPWAGSHVAPGHVRPLIRTLQGLDPTVIANVFARARCIGEKEVRGEGCFILKVVAQSSSLASRSETLTETIHHIILGYFSQKTGLLIHLEDSQFTRTRATAGREALFCEITLESTVEDYKCVEGLMIAHFGRTNAALLQYKCNNYNQLLDLEDNTLQNILKTHQTKTFLEEEWSLDNITFEVSGLCIDHFVPPLHLHQ